MKWRAGFNSIRSRPRGCSIKVGDEDGAWLWGASRYVWEMAILRPGESSRGLLRRNMRVSDEPACRWFDELASGCFASHEA